MGNLNSKYRLVGKALPPRPIKLEVPGWAGSLDFKRENGSQPQPWHCLPFVEAAAYGVELVYQYETECHVVNDGGEIRFEWDYANEPGIKLATDQFGVFAPHPPKFYFFGTMVDLQAPVGHVLRTETHPRFFTDDTGTVPAALCGHVQSEWWSKMLFVVFKVPPPGQHHVFRKGEPFVQILFVPQDAHYETTRMTPEEDEARTELERSVEGSSSYIAKKVWHNTTGAPFSDYYKVLARAFAREGKEGVQSIAHAGVEARQAALPNGKTLAELLDLGQKYLRERRHVEARDVYLQILRVDPMNAEAKFQMGNLAEAMGLHDIALQMMTGASTLNPRSILYRVRLAEVLKGLERYKESEAWLRSALQLSPGDLKIAGLLNSISTQKSQSE